MFLYGGDPFRLQMLSAALYDGDRTAMQAFMDTFMISMDLPIGEFVSL